MADFMIYYFIICLSDNHVYIAILKLSAVSCIAFCDVACVRHQSGTHRFVFYVIVLEENNV